MKNLHSKSLFQFLKVLTYLSIFITVSIGISDLKDIYLYFFYSGENFDLLALSLFLVLSACLSGVTDGLEDGL